MDWDETIKSEQFTFLATTLKKDNVTRLSLIGEKVRWSLRQKA